jgi:hypothetical protein
MSIQKLFSLFLFFVFTFAGFAKTDRWNEQTTYQDIIEEAQKGSPYFQGLLGIYLRSGEAGSSVNVELSKKWSNVAANQDHPFGAYNLANLAMLEGDLVSATTLYQDAAFRLQRMHRTETQLRCTAWERLIFRLFQRMFPVQLICLFALRN